MTCIVSSCVVERRVLTFDSVGAAAVSLKGVVLAARMVKDACAP